MPFCYVYSRTSTDEQQISPEWQRQVCLTYYEAALKDRGFELGGVFDDVGQSAYKIELPERTLGRELFKLLRPGDIIIAAKQDRLWRNTLDKEKCCFYWKQTNIHWCALDVNVDTSTAAGKFASTIIGAQSQWESDQRSERLLAYHMIRRKRKIPFRRWPPPGWHWDKVAEQMVPDTDERKLLELIYRWRANKVRSIKKTCEWLSDEGVRRKCGSKYHNAWVMRAYRQYLLGWPMEGYNSNFWKLDKSLTPEEKDKYRIGKPGKNLFFKDNPGRASAADLKWLSAAYSISLPRVS
jgi:DNA invertase Pin-like site-specific DNA recombinase